MIAVAAAIYLLDCVVLLERGQALWARGALSFGSRHYQIRGKVVALLNPFTPFIPSFRTAPLFTNASNVNASEAARALAPIGPMAVLQFALMFIALPFCLYRAPGWPFFVALVLAYVNALLVLALLAWRFGGANLPRRALIGLGFGWLACLPLSINALRKAALSFDLSMDARQAIRDLSNGEQARSDLAAQIEEAMQELEEGDERHRRLDELKRQLAAESRA